jgi:O-antigen ligase
MDPRLRSLLFGLAASALAVWVGVTLANEEHFIALLSAGLAAWVVLSWTRGPLAEAWLLGFLLLGYVVGNRGFAQLSPVSGLPVFFSELGLGIVLVLVTLRGALRRELPVQRDWLNGLLLLWLALGSARILWDVRTHGVVALRDFAMIYYLLYFFGAQALARHAPSRRLLHGSLLVTFGLLPLTGVIDTVFPNFFQTYLLAGDVPLIYYKGDLLATFLFTGFLLLLPHRRFDFRSDGLRWLLALVSVVLGLTLLSRSSMLGLAVGCGWLAWSGRWRPFRVLVAVCAGGLVAVVAYSLLQKKDFTQTKAYAIYESAASIGDYQGTRSYQNDQSGNKGDNNRYRLVWWKNIVKETFATDPVFGQGFGADLAKGFFLEYYPTTEPDFNPRSPHNIFMTTLGRMGLVGTAVLAAIYWVQARATARSVRAARGEPERDENVTLQAALWVIMVCACFGVVLEGPMGAIPFWIMLGLATQAGSGETTG